MLGFSRPCCCKYWHNLGQTYHPSCVSSRAPCVQDGNRDAQHYGGVGRKKAAAQTGEILCYPTLKWREDAQCLNQETSGSPDTWMKRAIPKCLIKNTCEEMSAVQDIYSLVRLCVCKLTCTSLYIFQQRSPNCSILTSFLLNFMPPKKKSRDFVWVVVLLLLYKGYGQRLEEQNILLIYINASLMQIWCNRAPPFQLHVLETPAPTRKPVSAVTGSAGYLHYWAHKKDILQNEVPSQTVSPPLGWRDSRSSRTTRAWHRYLKVKLSSRSGAALSVCLVSNQHDPSVAH